MATEKVTFTIDEKVMERLKALAVKEKRSVSQMATILIEESLDNREK